MAVAAFVLVDAIIVTSELPTPTLQSAQPHAKKQRQLLGTSTCGYILIPDLQSLLAVVMRAQSAQSSSQKA